MRFHLPYRCLLAALLAGPPSLSTATWDLPLFTAPSQAVLDAAGKIAAPPGADVTAIDLDLNMHLDAEGRLHWLQRSVWRVLTTAGVARLSTVTAAWSPWQQDKPKVRVRVISPDGIAHVLSESALTEAGIPAQLVAGVFSDRKLFRGPMPAIQPGAVVEMEVDRQDRETIFPGGQFGQFPLGATGPIQHFRLVVEGPPGIQAVAQGFSARRSEETAGAVHRIVLEADDLAAPRRLVLPPPEAVPGPTVSVAAGATWQSVAAWYAAIVDSKIGPLPQPSQPAARQISSARLVEILASLHKRVRYTGLELGMSAVVPSSPAETLDRGYGDCKDKSVVLAGELRQLGYPAHLALLRPFPAPEVSADLAGIEAFTHAIVYLPGTPAIWIDPTAEYVPAGRLPAMDEDRQALIVDSGTTGLIRTRKEARATTGLSKSRRSGFCRMAARRSSVLSNSTATRHMRCGSFSPIPPPRRNSASACLRGPPAAPIRSSNSIRRSVPPIRIVGRSLPAGAAAPASRAISPGPTRCRSPSILDC